jgi:hypothetical protein
MTFGFNPFFPLGSRGAGGGGTAPSSFTVLDSDGNSFSPSFAVLDSDGNSFTVLSAVLDSDGNSFNPI